MGCRGLGCFELGMEVIIRGRGGGCWSLKSELKEWMVCVRLETGPGAARWGE